MGQRTTQIHYWVPFQESGDNDCSLLQGFSEGLFEVAALLRWITRLPAVVEELYIDTASARLLRINGLSRFLVMPIALPEISHVRISESVLIHVVLSTEGTVDVVAEWCSVLTPRPIHVTTCDRRGVLHVTKLTRARLRRLVDARVGRSTSGGRSAVGRLSRCGLGTSRTDHNTVAPNEDALYSAGFGFRDRVTIVPQVENADDPYLRAIERTLDQIKSVRAEVAHLHGKTPEMIITTPDFYRSIAGARVSSRSVAGSCIAFADVKDACGMLRNQVTYAFLTDTDVALRLVAPEPNALGALIGLRTDELRVYTAGLSVRASSELSGVCRLPPVSPEVIDASRHLGACFRGRSAQRRSKTRKCFRKLQTSLRRLVPDSLYSRVLDATDGIRLVSDYPLEWIPSHCGLPLMLTHVVSRTTSTPGNLMLANMLPRVPLHVRSDALLDILLLRSLQPDDPLYGLVVKAIDGFRSSIGERLKVRVADVRDIHDIVSACSEFRGAMMIYDGHGVHRHGGSGELLIGNERVNPWSLRGRVIVPPVVVLSACDTLPIDREHPSVANAFLSMGARVVVGSLLPIDGRLSAIFVARLLYAIAAMVPCLTVSPMLPVKWSAVFTKVLRGQFVTELTLEMEKHGADLRSASMMDAMIETRRIIVSDDHGWYPLVLRRLAGAVGIAVERLEEIVADAGLMQSFMYTQMGDPESIGIVTGEVSAVGLGV